ncbi:CheR family methyltransferase, partial [Pseudomonas sp. DE0010]|uniref:CheR family methyltransferase n=1 Tax=Pseudomonas sp. DE0010 TaxID=2584951 RepID=UPI00273F5D78
FYAVDGAYRVRRSLRERMVFAVQDLLLDPPFAAMDLISCRNLLIYLESETIDFVLQLLHGALRPGGYLLLGKSEAYPLHRFGFEPVALRWNLPRKA